MISDDFWKETTSQTDWALIAMVNARIQLSWPLAINTQPDRAALPDRHHTQNPSIGFSSLESASNEPESVTGFLRITSDKVNKILALSGHHLPFFASRKRSWIFCCRMGPSGPTWKWRWILAQYHRRCRWGRPHVPSVVKARADLDTDYRKAASLLRPIDPDYGRQKASHVGKLVEWLETCGWKDVSLESQPSRQREWIYRAKHEDPAHSYAYDIGNNHTIGISQHFDMSKLPLRLLLKLRGVHSKIDLQNPGFRLRPQKKSPCQQKCLLRTSTWKKVMTRMNKRKIRKPSVPPTMVRALRRNDQRPFLKVKLTNTKFLTLVAMVTALFGLLQLLLLMPCRMRPYDEAVANLSSSCQPPCKAPSLQRKFLCRLQMDHHNRRRSSAKKLWGIFESMLSIRSGWWTWSCHNLDKAQPQSPDLEMEWWSKKVHQNCTYCTTWGSSKFHTASDGLSSTAVIVETIPLYDP